MPKPDLPKMTDPENSHFHPVFKAAAEKVISEDGCAGKVFVKSQYPSPTGPIDLVLFNAETNKVILPVEIKRTQSSVRGIGRRQCRDYWNNLGAECETQFYCVTNLELVELFRHDAEKPRTVAQRVKLTKPIAGQLELTPKKDFYINLQETIKEILEIIRGQKPYIYATGFSEFQLNLESKSDNHDEWHQLFIPVCFEYIRGAATQVVSLSNQTTTWRSASMYRKNPHRLVQLGSVIDFIHVFKAPETLKNDDIAFSSEVIKEAFEAGKSLGRGDDVADLVNEILRTPKGPGIVETDSELAQLLAVIARDSLGRELLPNEEVFDPGSGSGRLLTALPITAFPSIGPSQIKANEKEMLFSEALSLRLGLAFGAVLSSTNAPVVTISGIESVDVASLVNVRLIVMNPPYLSGVQAVEIKKLFSDRINAISGSNALLDIGQVALEILFLELVWHLVQNETVIATVFPIQHLTRLSDEVVALRKFLSNDFALTHVVIYPRQDLFEKVIKQTVLLVGQKSDASPDPEIKIVEVQTSVNDLDLDELLTKIQTGNSHPTHGVVVSLVSRDKLYRDADIGWKEVLGAGVRASDFIRKHMHSYISVESLGKTNVRRGMLGNNGNTALTVFSRVNPKYPSVVSLIPLAWLRPVLNTTETMPRILTRTGAPEVSFLPDLAAYDSTTTDNAILMIIIDEYLRVHQPQSGTQVKAIKTPETILSNLKSNQKDFGGGWVLIQRASRTKGEVSLFEEGGVLLSTNVPMIHFSTERERKLFASWMLSVFGQIQLELVCTPQEGMRKLEIKPIKKVLFPDFSMVSAHIEASLFANLATEPAHDFSSILPRPSDILWSQVVDPTSSEKCLSRALSLFQELVDERSGFG